MNYNFEDERDCINFLSGFRKKVVEHQSTIYFDDKNKKVIKLFSSKDKNFDGQKVEEKLIKLMKLRDRFSTAILPETILKCKGKCIGYVMPKIDNATSLRDLQVLSRKKKADLKQNLKIACNLARLIQDLHNAEIALGTFSSDHFMVKNEKIYMCNTDMWRFENKHEYYETDYFSLAVTVFEILVGFNPYEGEHPLIKKHNKKIMELNHISILGNHELNGIDDFKMEYVAWMSEELQTDFLKIFEGNARYNILPSLEKQAKELKKCPKHQYFNTSRYYNCPCCQTYLYDDSLNKFKNFKVDSISYNRYGIFAQQNIREIFDFFTIFDYENNAIHMNNSGQLIKTYVTPKTDMVYFTPRGIVVKISKIGRERQFLYTLFGKFKAIYGDCSFFEKMQRSRDITDPVCTMDIYGTNGERLYSDFILKSSSKIMVSGNHLFYLKNRKKLIDMFMIENMCTKKVITTITNPFIYEINELGEYCICSSNKKGYLDIIIDGRKVKQLINENPIVVRYDYITKQWCVITRKISGGYNTYIIGTNNKINITCNELYFAKFMLENCIFFNSMLVLPADKRIIFLKIGSTIEEIRIIEKQIGIVNNNSKIAIQYNPYMKQTYLYVQNIDQVYKMKLNY